MRESFQRHAVIGIDAHFVAGFQRGFHQLGRTLQNQRLHAVFRTDAKPIVAEHLGDFRDRARPFQNRDRPR